MEIIRNVDYVVIRAETKPPTYWWEAKEFPNDEQFSCTIQALAPNSESQQLVLSLHDLHIIETHAMEAKAKTKQSWDYPIANCCNLPRPRSETNQGWFLERFEVTCKPGYGCKDKLKAVT